MIAALRELLAKATPGPWCQHPNGTSVWSGVQYDCDDDAQLHICSVGCKAAMCEPARVVADLELIVECRNALPALLDRVEALEVERDNARADARVLAHAYVYDTRPPADIVKRALAYPVDSRTSKGGRDE